MGRVLRLILLGLIVYIVALVLLFPASPLVARLEAQIKPLVLERVEGRAFNGRAALARLDDDLLPVRLENLRWRLAPSTLLSGAVGSQVSFDGYGGQGQGVVARSFGGEVRLRDFTFNVESARLVPLLPVPLALFSGMLVGEITTLDMDAEGALQSAQGALQWEQARFETPINFALGTVNVDIEPRDGQSQAAIRASGGDVGLDGTASLAPNGDFVVDIVITPSADAPRALVENLQRVGRPESGGRFRIREQGNINRLM